MERCSNPACPSNVEDERDGPFRTAKIAYGACSLLIFTAARWHFYGPGGSDQLLGEQCQGVGPFAPTTRPVDTSCP